MSRVTPRLEEEGPTFVRTVTLRPPSELRPHQVFEAYPRGQRLLIQLPSTWRAQDVVTAAYKADAYGILQPAHATGTVGRELPPFVTWSCMLGGCSVFFVLSFFTFLCVLPYVLVPALGLALLSIVPVVVFGVFVHFHFADSVRIFQMITSFFEAIAWFFPFVGIILIIYFPVGWQDWVSTCTTDVAMDTEMNAECLGKKAIQAYLMTAFLEELLKFFCVRRLLWFPFVSDAWALCCYGGAAGLGFAALENAIYVGSGSLTTALLRAGTAVPNHLMYGLLHGAFLSQLRFGPRGHCHPYFLSPFVPMFLHGSHNFSIALCQYVDLSLGLSIMFLIALMAVLLLRYSMRKLGTQVKVHELINAKLVEAPSWCLCCQGVCGWPVTWPPGAPVMAELDLQWHLSEKLLLQGLGDGRFDVFGDLLDSLSTEMAPHTGKFYFETLIDHRTTDFRIGVRSSGEGWEDVSEALMLAPNGLFGPSGLLQERSIAKTCTIGCMLDLDASLVHFTEDDVELFSVAIELVEPNAQWLVEWQVTGQLLIKLEHFEKTMAEAHPFQVALDPQFSTTPVVGQVVGVMQE